MVSMPMRDQDIANLRRVQTQATHAAFDQVGGANYLAQMAYEQPAAFMTLVGKVLPLQVTGENGGAVLIQQIKRTIVRPAADADS